MQAEGALSRRGVCYKRRVEKRTEVKAREEYRREQTRHGSEVKAKDEKRIDKDK